MALVLNSTLTHAGETVRQQPSSSNTDSAVWEEEQVALQAIFDKEVSFPSQQQALVSADVHGTRLVLDFRIPLAAYPDALPFVGVR